MTEQIKAALMGDPDAAAACTAAGVAIPCGHCGFTELDVETTIIRGKGGCDLFNWRVRCECGLRTDVYEDQAIRDDDGIRLTLDGRRTALATWNRRVRRIDNDYAPLLPEMPQDLRHPDMGNGAHDIPRI